MLFLIAYISSVVLINYAFSTAPHLDIIWSAWGGLVFVLRDMVQTRIDWLVFSITKRPLHDRLWISSALSIPLDTFIFFGMIDAFTPAVILTAMGSKFAGVTVVWLIMAWRLRKLAIAG